MGSITDSPALTHGGISENARDSIFGPPPEEPEEPVVPSEANPWNGMMTHAAIDSYIDDPANGLTRPVGWSTMTIAQKKEWLDSNG